MFSSRFSSREYTEDTHRGVSHHDLDSKDTIHFFYFFLRNILAYDEAQQYYFLVAKGLANQKIQDTYILMC